jgi:ATP-dependent DNA helicase 2 subunit 1
MMRDVVRQLSLPKGIYDQSKYPNPALQWHYQILQALALEEDLPEQPEDKTKPKYRQIDKRVGAEVTDWGIELENAFREHQKANHGSGGSVLKKRSANGENAGPAPSKRIKTEAGEVVSEQQMRKLWEKQQVGKLTVQQLKDFCIAKSIPVSGKKVDLVGRIAGWFETR